MGALDDLVFHNGSVILPDRVLTEGVVVCREGRVDAVGAAGEIEMPPSCEHVDAKGGFISPGFVDQHVHGGGGADFMDGQLSAVRTAIAAHTRHGTTTLFPTTTTGAPEQLVAMMEACEMYSKGWEPAEGARLAGVHLYGPYFAEAMIGAHPRDGYRDPDPAEYLPLLKRGIVRIATCAAELPGACDFYRAASAAGCLVTCGHSNASFSEMAAGFAAGLRHVDHFWCAMSSVSRIKQRFGFPMQGSMAEFVLFEKGMSTEVIPDGQHLAPELLEFAYRVIGPDRLCLVTDACRAMEAPPGNYRLGPRDSGREVVSDGSSVRTADAGGLASSIEGMDHMIRHMKAVTTAPLHDVVRMASLVPAQRTGIDAKFGSLDQGKYADIVVLDLRLRVRRVFVRGVEYTGVPVLA